MLTPTKKLYYALEAMLYIAYNAKTAPVPGNAVAEAQGLPIRYLEPVMQKLVRAGLLKSVRGPTGGYQLGRERRNISLAEICDVAGGKNQLPACVTTLGEKVLKPIASELLNVWHGELAGLTLETLCQRASGLNIATTAATPTDFTI